MERKGEFGLQLGKVEVGVIVSSGVKPFLSLFESMGFSFESLKSKNGDRIWLKTEDEEFVSFLEDPLTEVVLNAACGRMEAADVDLVDRSFGIRGLGRSLYLLSLRVQGEYWTRASNEARARKNEPFLNNMESLGLEFKEDGALLRVQGGLDALVAVGVKERGDLLGVVRGCLEDIYDQILYARELQK